MDQNSEEENKRPCRFRNSPEITERVSKKFRSSSANTYSLRNKSADYQPVYDLQDEQEDQEEPIKRTRNSFNNRSFNRKASRPTFYSEEEEDEEEHWNGYYNPMYPSGSFEDRNDVRRSARQVHPPSRYGPSSSSRAAKQRHLNYSLRSRGDVKIEDVLLSSEYKRRKSSSRELNSTNPDETLDEQHQHIEEESSEPIDVDIDEEDEDFEEEEGHETHLSEEEEEGIFVGGKLLRPRKHSHGSQNNTRYNNNPRIKKSRNLREKKPINYANQMYPQAFKEVEQLEFLDRNNMLPSKEAQRALRAPWNSHPRNHSNNHKQFRLNESDEEDATPIPKGRIFALLRSGASKPGSIQPLNLTELLQAQKSSLLSRVDEKTRSLYQEKAPLTQQETSRVDLDQVAGLDGHISSLKEMVGIPLMYPELFSKFSITAPRGVLFYGPPGTGKTLMARALAASCSTSSRPVAFFLRKGADVLNKWVGESEKQLRLLFEQAKAWQPSIIFFDEIDGLAPVRSSKQDQIHASIVSTLLALMDGLDNRGQVIVIGATNRIDSIDPALRRPGRFDREFYFPLPSEEARKKMIDLNTSTWNPRLAEDFKWDLAHVSKGYNGADMKALCTEAALCAIRRSVPQIYNSKIKLKLDLQDISVIKSDFLAAMKKIVSSTERSSFVHSKELSPDMKALLKGSLTLVQAFVENTIQLFSKSRQLLYSNSCHSSSGLVMECLKGFEPHLLLSGPPCMGQNLLQAHLMSVFEKEGFFIQTLELSSILSSESSPEMVLTTFFHELKRHKQAVLFIQRLDEILNSLSESSCSVFYSFLTREPLVVIASTDTCIKTLASNLQDDSNPTRVRVEANFIQDFFSQSDLSSKYAWKVTIELNSPSFDCRREYFQVIFKDLEFSFFKIQNQLSFVPSKVIDLDQGHLEQQVEQEEEQVFLQDQVKDLAREFDKHKLCSRQYFSLMLEDLKKNYRAFARPVDVIQNPEYNPEHPMDLGTMEAKALNNEYETMEDVMQDINLIVSNVEMYNDPQIPYQKENILKALKLRDAAEEHILLIPRDFIQACWLFKLLNASAKGSLPKELAGEDQELKGMETDVEEMIRPGSSQSSLKKFCISDDDEEEDVTPINLELNGSDPMALGLVSTTFTSTVETIPLNHTNTTITETEEPLYVQETSKLNQNQQMFIQEMIQEISIRTRDMNMDQVKQIGVAIASIVLTFSNYTNLDDLLNEIKKLIDSVSCF